MLPLLVATIIGQRVTGIQAARSWAAICRRFGEPAPGPVEPVAAADRRSRSPRSPTTGSIRAASRRSRADTIRRCAFDASALERLVDSPAQLDARLRFIPGVGPWTAGLVLGGAAGDPDAVPVGDLHLPGIVCFTLTGDASGGDERMLELLAPYAGHRGRVARLCVLLGVCPRPAAPPAKPSSRSPTSDPGPRAPPQAGLMIERTMRPLNRQSTRCADACSSSVRVLRRHVLVGHRGRERERRPLQQHELVPADVIAVEL